MSLKEKQCDLECEKALRKILHKLEEQFREHHTLFLGTVEEQKLLLDSMWTLCQRFLILTKGGICVRPYPPEPAKREEREIKHAFSAKKDLLRQSNYKLAASMCSVSKMCGAFDRVLAKVDASVPCSIIEGNETREPIFYYIELYSDLHKFFHKIQTQLDMLGRFLMVDDIGSILEYKQLLEQDKGVQHFFGKCLLVEKKSNE